MGCCLAALISDFPSAAKHTSKATTTFLAKIAKGEEDGAEEMALLTRRVEGNEEDFVPTNDNPGASIDASMRHNDGKNVTNLMNTTKTGAPPQMCCTPAPTKEANQSAKKRRENAEIQHELSPSRQSTRIAEKKMASTPKDGVSPQRKQAPIADAAAATAATTTTAATRARKPVKRKNKFGLPDTKKVPVKELEVRYSTTGHKVYVCFSDDSDDEDYIADDSSN